MKGILQDANLEDQTTRCVGNTVDQKGLVQSTEEAVMVVDVLQGIDGLGKRKNACLEGIEILVFLEVFMKTNAPNVCTVVIID